MGLQEVTEKIQHVMDYEVLVRKFGDVAGFLDPVEGYVLMLLASEQNGPGAVVEIGSYMGRSTCWLATGLKRVGTGKVVAVDHFEGSKEHKEDLSELSEPGGSTYPQFEANLKAGELWDYVDARVASSEAAAGTWQGPIRLLFIDGDHEYASVRHDFDLWSPFVILGGLVVFHDVTLWDGPTQCYEEVSAPGQDYTELFTLGSLGVLRRDK